MPENDHGVFAQGELFGADLDFLEPFPPANIQFMHYLLGIWGGDIHPDIPAENTPVAAGVGKRKIHKPGVPARGVPGARRIRAERRGRFPDGVGHNGGRVIIPCLDKAPRRADWGQTCASLS